MLTLHLEAGKFIQTAPLTQFFVAQQHISLKTDVETPKVRQPDFAKFVNLIRTCSGSLGQTILQGRKNEP